MAWTTRSRALMAVASRLMWPIKLSPRLSMILCTCTRVGNSLLANSSNARLKVDSLGITRYRLNPQMRRSLAVNLQTFDQRPCRQLSSKLSPEGQIEVLAAGLFSARLVSPWASLQGQRYGVRPADPCRPACSDTQVVAGPARMRVDL